MCVCQASYELPVACCSPHPPFHGYCFRPIRFPAVPAGKPPRAQIRRRPGPDNGAVPGAAAGAGAGGGAEEGVPKQADFCGYLARCVVVAPPSGLSLAV